MRALFLRAFRNQFLVELLIRARGLVILPIATRELGPSGYGWIAFAAVLTGLVGTIATLGMPAAMSRFLPGRETDEERGAIYWPAFAVSAASVAAFALVTVAVFALAPISPEEIPFSLITLAAANVISNELKLFAYNFWRYTLELVPYYRFLKADVVLVGVGQLLVLVVFDGGPVALLAVTVGLDALLFGAALLMLVRQVPWRRPSWSILLPLYRFGLPLGATGLLNWANNSADRFFIQGYVGSAAVGIYSVGYNLGFLAVGLVATPVFAILSSVFFRAWDSGESEAAERILARCQSFLLLGCLPGILSLAFFGEPFVTLMAGDAFAAAHRYVALVGVGYLLMFLGDLYGYPLWVHRRQYLYSLAMVASVCVNILGNALFVPPFGAVASAAATTASLALLAFVLVLVNLRERYSRPPLGTAFSTSIAALACWGATSRLWPDSPTILDTAVFSGGTSALFAVVAYGMGIVPAELTPRRLRRPRLP